MCYCLLVCLRVGLFAFLILPLFGLLSCAWLHVFSLVCLFRCLCGCSLVCLLDCLFLCLLACLLACLYNRNRLLVNELVTLRVCVFPPHHCEFVGCFFCLCVCAEWQNTLPPKLFSSAGGPRATGWRGPTKTHPVCCANVPAEVI